MISYEKAKMGKQLMKQFIAEGELEKAAFLSGRNVLKISAKYGKPYTNRHGNPYRITRQLRSLLNSINRDSDFIFTRKKEYYIHLFHIYSTYIGGIII